MKCSKDLTRTQKLRYPVKSGLFDAGLKVICTPQNGFAAFKVVLMPELNLSLRGERITSKERASCIFFTVIAVMG